LCIPHKEDAHGYIERGSVATLFHSVVFPQDLADICYNMRQPHADVRGNIFYLSVPGNPDGCKDAAVYMA
jgi:hypothetical protein